MDEKVLRHIVHLKQRSQSEDGGPHKIKLSYCEMTNGIRKLFVFSQKEKVKTAAFKIENYFKHLIVKKNI